MPRAKIVFRHPAPSHLPASTWKLNHEYLYGISRERNGGSLNIIEAPLQEQRLRVLRWNTMDFVGYDVDTLIHEKEK